MKKPLHLLLAGFVIWLVPFVTAFGFYDSHGQLSVSQDLFKSVMIVVSSLAGSYMIYRHFKKIQADFVKEGWIIGMIWLAINLLLDLLILVPYAKMSLLDYFASIGLRYLQIPIMCVMAGALLQLRNSALK